MPDRAQRIVRPLSLSQEGQGGRALFMSGPDTTTGGALVSPTRVLAAVLSMLASAPLRAGDSR